MNYKILIATAMLIVVNVASSMEVNKQAVQDKGIDFIKKVDSQIGGYVRAFRRGSEVDFDALSLVMFINQTANIEKKLDMLIYEIRKNNGLLQMQMKNLSQPSENINKTNDLKN